MNYNIAGLLFSKMVVLVPIPGHAINKSNYVLLSPWEQNTTCY